MKNLFKQVYPLAARSTAKTRGVAKPCVHCGQSIHLSRWDSWNGFLVRCPYCTKLHGKNMMPKGILWVSFFLNALSFFFTVRPRKAVFLVIVFLLLGLLGYYSMRIELFHQLVEVGLVVVFLFLPVFLNAWFIYIHESNLKRSSGTMTRKGYELLSDIKDLVS